jgi:hypothetical protein
VIGTSGICEKERRQIMTKLFTMVGSNAQGITAQMQYDRLPDTCPVCHEGIVPRVVTGLVAGQPEKGDFHIVFQCSKIACQTAFIGIYKYSGPGNYRLHSVRPKTPRPASYSEPITTLSPTFVEVYNQAMAAESFELEQLVGIGLRKALEFLIKDFAIKKNSEKEADIRKAFLGKVINDYIDDHNVQKAASRATWLANDETHYTRRWEDKDISDLKILVRLTVNWIENVLLTEKYIEEMPG